MPPKQEPPRDPQRVKDDAVARGAEFGRSKYTGATEVVDDEDRLRVRAAREMGCEPEALRVSPREEADLPAGWAADVSGCNAAAVYIFSREGWSKRP